MRECWDCITKCRGSYTVRKRPLCAERRRRSPAGARSMRETRVVIGEIVEPDPLLQPLPSLALSELSQVGLLNGSSI